jgi:hypothetical protein
MVYQMVTGFGCRWEGMLRKHTTLSLCILKIPDQVGNDGKNVILWLDRRISSLHYTLHSARFLISLGMTGGGRYYFNRPKERNENPDKLLY